MLIRSSNRLNSMLEGVWLCLLLPGDRGAESSLLDSRFGRPCGVCKSLMRSEPWLKSKNHSAPIGEVDEELPSVGGSSGN